MNDGISHEELIERNSQRLKDLEAPSEAMNLTNFASPEAMAAYIDKNEAEWTIQRDSFRAMGLNRAEAEMAKNFGLSLERFAELKAMRKGV